LAARQASRDRRNEAMRGLYIRVLTIVVLFAAAIGVLFITSSGKRRVARLADGTEVDLLGVTQGPSNIFFPGGLRDELIYGFAPAKGIKIGSLKIGPVWQPGFELTDAMGNKPPYVNVTSHATDDFVYFEIGGTSLSPGEVWKLHMTFSKQEGPARKQAAPPAPRTFELLARPTAIASEQH
jgi:hypothetical protein